MWPTTGVSEPGPRGLQSSRVLTKAIGSQGEGIFYLLARKTWLTAALPDLQQHLWHRLYKPVITAHNLVPFSEMCINNE